MTFLHPWSMSIGVAASALPLIIHFLTRPAPRRMALSTIRFVSEALKQRAARHWLRDLLILLLRTAAILLIAAGIARPQPDAVALIQPDAPGDAVRVVLLDVSQSMAAEQGGGRVFERARAASSNHLADRTGLRAELILAAAQARPAFGRLSANLPALRDELGKAQPRPERLNLPAALSRAAELLGQSPEGVARRELVIISDFQRTGWAAADFAAVPADVRVQFESVAPVAPLPNLAILRAGPNGRVEVGREARIEVEVGNFTPAMRPVRVEVRVGDSFARIEGTCPAFGKLVLDTDLPARAAGFHTGEARLLDARDALAADDTRPFIVQARPAPLFALVTKQPAGPRGGSSYFLERALAPSDPRPGRSGPRVVRVEPGQFDRDTVTEADAIVFDHPGKQSPAAINLLVALMRRGRGVLYVAAESGDAVNLRAITEAAGGDLNLPVDFLPPRPGQPRRGLFLADVRRDRPPWTVFGESLPQITAPLRFGGGLESHRRDGALIDDELATYGDRSAALVLSPCGGGALAVLNADLGASNLPSSPVFVPLVGELIGRLLGRTRDTDAAPAGEPLIVRLPLEAGPLGGLLATAPVESDAGSLAEESGGVVWRCPAPTPGIYRVNRGGMTVFANAIATPAEEADLRPLDAGVLTGRLAGGRAVDFRSVAGDGDAEGPERLWAWLLVACVGCLVVELGVLWWFRS